VSYVCRLCLLEYSGVQPILCCVLVLFCFLFLRLVYPMLPASLDFPYLIATSVFSNFYFLWYDSLDLSNKNVDILFSAHGAFLEFF
jgi:hypothetical protein